MKKTSLQKSVFAAVLTGALCLVTACGGGGSDTASDKSSSSREETPAVSASVAEASSTEDEEKPAAVAEEEKSAPDEAADGATEEASAAVEKSAAETSGGVAETPDEAFAGIRVKDNVLFDEEGVKITFEGTRVNNGSAFFSFQQENNNPDNKKLMFGLVSINVNRLHIKSGASQEMISLHSSQTDKPYELESGENIKAETQTAYETRDYLSLMALLGTEVKDFPIECISFDFFVQIGSDGVKDYCSVTLQTDDYNGDSYMKLYGERCGTTHISGIDVYGKYDATGYTVVFLPTEELTGKDSIGAYNLAVNGKKLEKKENTDLTVPLGMGSVYPTGGIALHTSLTEDEIRKSLEIGNSEPLEFQLLNYNLDGGMMTLFTR